MKCETEELTMSLQEKLSPRIQDLVDEWLKYDQVGVTAIQRLANFMHIL